MTVAVAVASCVRDCGCWCVELEPELESDSKRQFVISHSIPQNALGMCARSACTFGCNASGTFKIVRVVSLRWILDAPMLKC